jgi:hypothetical protein
MSPSVSIASATWLRSVVKPRTICGPREMLQVATAARSVGWSDSRASRRTAARARANAAGSEFERSKRKRK